ncbi:MAG: alpha/beta hydrolase family protein [Anaerolineae bacterium]
MYDSQEHFAHLYNIAQREYAFRATTLEQVYAWQQAFRPRLEEALGLDAIAAQVAGHVPCATQLDESDESDHIRQRWVLQVEPTVPLPFVLLLPKGSEAARPLIITPHGHGRNTELYAGIYHSEEERLSIVEGERDVALQAVREGYIAIAPTTRGFGETRTEADREADVTSSCRTLLMHDVLVGRTPIGDRVWDVSRLLDWALANLPVDPRRVAVTGNSGGGTVSLFAAACDERIAVAAPASYFCTFAGSIGSIHHCDCNYVPGLLNLGEMYDVAGLIAPRAFIAIAGRQDPIFPIDQVRLGFERLQTIYAVAGVPERCALFVGEGGHRYYKQGAWPFIRQQFARLVA